MGIRTELKGVCFCLFGIAPVEPGKLCFSVLRPEFLLVLSKGCPGPEWPKKTVFRNFPPLGVRSVKTESVKKLRNLGENLLGQPDFPPKTAPSTGKLRFSVFRLEFI